MDWWNLMKQSVTVGAPLLWIGRYGCNNGSYGCTIVMSYIEINKAVSQWLLTFNLCISVTWPLTCAFHIPCTHTPEIIDMHRGVCDNMLNCFKDYKRCIHILNRLNSILAFGLTQVDEINSETTIHVVCPTQPIPCLPMLWRLYQHLKS